MFSHRYPFQSEPFYISERYAEGEPLYVEDSEILWEIRYIESDCAILVLMPIRRLIAVEANETIIEAKGKAAAILNVSSKRDDMPVLVGWIEELWRILDKYWKNAAPIYALRKARRLNTEDCAEEIFKDLKDFGFYV